MERIRNSWNLVKESYAVLRADRELLVFPILSGIAGLIVMAAFLVPSLSAGMLDQLLSGRGMNITLFTFVVTFLFYFAQYFVITFCNAALIGAAMIRLKGGDPTVGDGFRIAFSRLGTILGYTLIASTVGMLLRTLSEKGKGLGRLAAGLFGLAWNLVVFLAVPVLVVEGVGPIEAVKRSAQLLKKTWGEQIAGNLGVGTFFGLLFLGLFMVTLIPGIALSVVIDSPWVILTAVAVLVVGIIVLSLLSSALSGIYAAAVYRFAAEGETGGYFSSELVQGAFRTK